MISLLTALLVAQQNVSAISQTLLPNPGSKDPKLLIQFYPDERLPKPKLSPKKFGVDQTRFEFDFFTGGYANIGQPGKFPMRFRVYEQQRRSHNDVAFAVTEMLLRLWEYDFNRLRLDHSPAYDQQMVDVYLCWGGIPGGQQQFDVDPDLDHSPKVNTIYIYDLPSFTNPVEMAREVAHEYGHAALPAIGGFKSPEDWGNGYLGERLFLTYLRDRLMKGELVPQDAMGASGPELDTWVKKNVDPLVVAAATSPPDLAVLGGTGQKAMDAYMGLTLYCSQLLPDAVFRRSIGVASGSAKDIPDTILTAVEEQDAFTITIPASLSGKQIWIPVSKARVTGAKVISTKNGWALIKPEGATVKLLNQPPT